MGRSKQELVKYLQENPLTDGDGDIHTMVGLLYLWYTGGADSNNAILRSCFRKIDSYTCQLPFAQRDDICCTLTQLCAEQQRTAFLDGVRAGAQLALELTE